MKKFTNIALGFRPARQEIKALEDVINFGRYKNHTVQWIVENKPSYFLWMIDNDTVDLKEDELYWMAQLNQEDEEEKWYPYRHMSRDDFLSLDD
jgi:predicted patatin/cPLA2 family phospholipase